MKISLVLLLISSLLLAQSTVQGLDLSFNQIEQEFTIPNEKELTFDLSVYNADYSKFFIIGQQLGQLKQIQLFINDTLVEENIQELQNFQKPTSQVYQYLEQKQFKDLCNNSYSTCYLQLKVKGNIGQKFTLQFLKKREWYDVFFDNQYLNSNDKDGEGIYQPFNIQQAVPQNDGEFSSFYYTFYVSKGDEFLLSFFQYNQNLQNQNINFEVQKKRDKWDFTLPNIYKIHAKNSLHGLYDIGKCNISYEDYCTYYMTVTVQNKFFKEKNNFFINSQSVKKSSYDSKEQKVIISNQENIYKNKVTNIFYLKNINSYEGINLNLYQEDQDSQTYVEIYLKGKNQNKLVEKNFDFKNLHLLKPSSDLVIYTHTSTFPAQNTQVMRVKEVKNLQLYKKNNEIKFNKKNTIFGYFKTKNMINLQALISTDNINKHDLEIKYQVLTDFQNDFDPQQAPLKQIFQDDNLLIDFDPGFDEGEVFYVFKFEHKGEYAATYNLNFALYPELKYTQQYLNTPFQLQLFKNEYSYYKMPTGQYNDDGISLQGQNLVDIDVECYIEQKERTLVTKQTFTNNNVGVHEIFNIGIGGKQKYCSLFGYCQLQCRFRNSKKNASQPHYPQKVTLVRYYESWGYPTYGNFLLEQNQFSSSQQSQAQLIYQGNSTFSYIVQLPSKSSKMVQISSSDLDNTKLSIEYQIRQEFPYADTTNLSTGKVEQILSCDYDDDLDCDFYVTIFAQNSQESHKTLYVNLQDLDYLQTLFMNEEVGEHTQTFNSDFAQNSVQFVYQPQITERLYLAEFAEIHSYSVYSQDGETGKYKKFGDYKENVVFINDFPWASRFIFCVYTNPQSQTLTKYGKLQSYLYSQQYYAINAQQDQVEQQLQY